MKITCNQKDLLKGLNLTAKACGRSTTMPILECFHLECKQGQLIISATNTDITIQTPVTALIEGDTTATYAVASKLFNDIIRSLPDGQVVLEKVDNELVVKCNKSEYSVPVQDGKDFPATPAVEATLKFQVKSDQLRKAIQNTIFSVSQDDTRPILTGEIFEIEGNKLNIVAVDGYRIAVRTIDVQVIQGQSGTIVIPGKALEEIQKIATEDPVVISVNNQYIQCTAANTILTSRVLEGEPMKYKAVFAQTQANTKVTVGNKEFLEAVTRTTLISEGSKKNPTRLTVNGSALQLTAQASLGKGKEEVECLLEGPGLEIAFNPKYLVDIFKTIDTENVTLNMNSSLTPAIIEGEDYKYLVLPIRIQE